MGNRLLVEGLDWSVNDAALRSAFAPFGRVLEARVMTDWETGRSRGFGFVTLDDDTASRLAIETMDGARLAGKVLRVMPAPDATTRAGYRGGDYGVFEDAPDEKGGTDYRGGDYSDGRKTPPDRSVYRSADFGYADGPTKKSTFRSADFDGGRRRAVTATQPNLEPIAPPAAEAAPPSTPGEPDGDGAKAAGPKRRASGWESGGDGSADNKKPFG